MMSEKHTPLCTKWKRATTNLNLYTNATLNFPKIHKHRFNIRHCSKLQLTHQVESRHPETSFAHRRFLPCNNSFISPFYTEYV